MAQSNGELDKIAQLLGFYLEELDDDGFMPVDVNRRTLENILADRKQHELDAMIAGIEEAHKEILDVVFTYRSKDPNFCDVDDVSRVSMSWKIDRIAKLKAEREAL